MAAVENATEDGTLDAFPFKDEDDAEPDNCDCDGLDGFHCWECTSGSQCTTGLTHAAVFIHVTSLCKTKPNYMVTYRYHFYVH